MPQAWRTGMRGFTLVWLGQLVSALGSGMTAFAITIWAWQTTGQATVLALVGLCTFAPSVLLAPLAGALVDRYDRRRVMILTDLGSSLPAMVMLLLHLAGALEVWHLFVLGAWAGACNAFQFPAYSAAVSTMVAKAHYARASGMLSLVEATSAIAAPVLAGLLLAVAGIAVVFVIDIVTFGFAVATLLVVAVPSPPPLADAPPRRSVWREALFGFTYILDRRPLLHLQMVFTAGNLAGTFGLIVLAPMVLARTGDDGVALGAVQAALGAGGLVGGIVLGAWGGPRRRVRALLVGLVLNGAATVLLGLGRDVQVWMVAGFAMMAVVPILNGASQAVWQSKVPPALQGRVFAARRMIAAATAPLAMLVAGPVADRLLEPAMAPGGALAPILGPLVGTGPGTGMALMVVVGGLGMIVAAVTGLLVPTVRSVERAVPDHDAATVEAAPAEPVPAPSA